MNLRVYLAGRMVVETPKRVVEERDFVGRQGRSAFAYLVLARNRPVSRSELAEAIWSEAPPPAHEAALSAIISKLRGALAGAGFDTTVLGSLSGCYELRLPSATWIDVEAAADAIHDAEFALRSGNPAAAYGPSAVAHHIARRPFLAGDESRWASGRRDKLRAILLRALECRARVYLWNGEHSLAVEAAREAIELEPFRETAHQLLMQAHGASGNTAEALHAYERCRRLIADEHGADPSPETRALHLALLQGRTAPAVAPASASP
jgi:DNA-binding SARP family transcriptional activator